MTARRYAFAIAAIALLTGSCAKVSDDLMSSDPANVRITLQRSACFGSCPDYRVTVFGDGRVVFTTETKPADEVAGVHRQFAMSQGVLLPGTHTDLIEPNAVIDLVEQFRKAGFSVLKPEYSAGVTDAPTYVLTYQVGNRHKSVIDYVGQRAGMPKAVTDLEQAVDRTAGSDRWVRGSVALIAWLEKQRFDFSSPEAAQLAVTATAGEADEATVLSLIERGAPLATTVGTSGRNAEPAGQSILRSAIQRGRGHVFGTLASSGWLNRLGKQEAGELFAVSAAGCSPELVDAVADAGVGIDLPAMVDPRADPSDAQGRTALAELAGTYCDGGGADQVTTARRLLELGADPNRSDSLGRTAIYGVENLDLLNLLLSHGADATVKDKDGRSMVFGSWTDAIVLRLLEAGASPVGRYDYDNKTLAQQAKDRRMPKVSQWLAAHSDGTGR
jgi:hypothetical protein